MEDNSTLDTALPDDQTQDGASQDTQGDTSNDSAPSPVSRAPIFGPGYNKGIKYRQHDWDIIREDYIHNGIDLRTLAKKYQVNLSVLSYHSEKEGWVKARAAFQDKVKDGFMTRTESVAIDEAVRKLIETKRLAIASYQNIIAEGIRQLRGTKGTRVNSQSGKTEEYWIEPPGRVYPRDVLDAMKQLLALAENDVQELQGDTSTDSEDVDAQLNAAMEKLMLLRRAKNAQVIDSEDVE